MSVPLFDTETTLAPVRERILQRIMDVVENGRFILGPEVGAFEQELADYIGVRHAIGVGNGTDALTIAARAVGVRPGDDVVVPAFTFYASAEAIASLGARPVFCDVDPATRNVTVESVRAALTPETRAIVAVDLFGMPSPAAEIEDTLGLPVIEDAAQAIGATQDGRAAGSLSTVATFSFYPSKNLGAFGDGGAIVTDDDEVAAMARALRFHGSRDKQSFEYVGYNSRLDEIQAAVLRVLLPELEAWSRARRAAATAYDQAGLGDHVALPFCAPGSEPAWHLYVVTHPAPDEALARLHAAGIGARSSYRTPLHRQPAMSPYLDGVRPPELPVTEELARTNLAVPMHPALTESQVSEVVAALAG